MTFDQIKAVLKNKRVGIAGCGGLGSNCAVALARIGVGTLVIADFDHVSEGNLNRQYYFSDQIGMKKVVALSENLKRITSLVTVIGYDLRLDAANIPEVFSGCEVVVEAFDHSGEKKMLIETLLERMPEMEIVTGLGMAGWGDTNSLHYRRMDNLHICGDEKSEIGPDMPPMAPRVGIVAAMQANVVTEILLTTDRNII